MKTVLDYSQAAEGILAEASFDRNYFGKIESIFCQGNGYLGIRNVTEEQYWGESREMYVSGTFDRASGDTVPELPNAADVLEMKLILNGCIFTLQEGNILAYRRTLNLNTGECVRKVRWRSPAGDTLALEFRRIVSLNRLHVIAQQISIAAEERAVSVCIETGVNGRITNGGEQHFFRNAKRVREGRFLEYIQVTGESEIPFFFHTAISLFLNGESFFVPCSARRERRRLFARYNTEVPAGKTLRIEKISTVHTGLDAEFAGLSWEQQAQAAFVCCREANELGYRQLADDSARAWEKTVWKRGAVQIESKDPFDALALKFAQYHLHVMTPAHDERMNITAKGLSSDAYRGHTFWDTEIFILPYYTFTHPDMARRLVRYRCLSLESACGNARRNGWKGAQFPWEAAGPNDGETSSEWGGPDLFTGEFYRMPYGQTEIHITADVVYGLRQYVAETGDEAIMEDGGYELVFQTAIFWVSRLQCGPDGLLHLYGVVGPDEYKNDVDDNAFTNYMAHWNIRWAVECCDKLQIEHSSLYRALDKRLDLARARGIWDAALRKMYLPQPDEDGIIPQTADYRSLKSIDLSAYKFRERVGSITDDYTWEELHGMQVSKQADTLLLFTLLGDYFSKEQKIANWHYYEPRTLHDSSLSLCTHSILASDVGDLPLAYTMFRHAAEIDLGPNMSSSDEGIHAASIGGIWQCAVLGFGGVRIRGGMLQITPALPNSWEKLSFFLWWHGCRIHVSAAHDRLVLENISGTKSVLVQVQDRIYTLDETLSIPLCNLN